MTIDTTKLRELAQQATPGPWHISAPAEHAVWHDINGARNLIAETSCDGNAEFIAAANPAVVLALLDEIDRLREDLNDARSEFVQVAAGLNDAAQCIARQSQTISRLQGIEAAARNLAKVRGRHHSEIAMDQLMGALK